MKTVLIIDDDININNLLNEALTKEGYNILRAWSGTEALMMLENSKPDLVLLDLMLPGLSGEEVFEKINNIPVIIISAKPDIENKIHLLRNGAVDYITKPFDIRELSARIELRLKESKTGISSSKIDLGEIVVDCESRLVFVNDNLVKVTKTEYAILKLLCLNPNRLLTRNLILDRISFETPDCVESSLNVHICNIRKKLKDFSDKDYIESVWGIGYKLTIS